jgi:hypothetical protein
MDDNNDLPRWMVAAFGKFVTLRSPEDHQDGLVICYSEAAAERIARKTPGGVVVEATPEMIVAAYRGAHRMGVPFVYFGRESGNDVYFTRLRLDLALGQFVKDGQHRHGKRE